jgi:ATP-dependent DNA ligase
MLLPNEKNGAPAPDWEQRIEHPSEWLISTKLDGGRVELFADGTCKGRSLKPIKSIHINRMAEDIALVMQAHPQTIIECEFFSPDMNFAEIMHFFRTEDVTSDKTVKKYTREWERTHSGTIGIYKGVEYPIEDITPEMKEDGAIIWSFPGRTPEWATTWHDSLKFYAFSLINIYDNGKEETFEQRARWLHHTIADKGIEDLIYVGQNEFNHIDELYQAYDQAIISGFEGLVVTRRDAIYKYGRYTLGSNQVYKIKDDNNIYDGKILEVLEGTEAREGAEKTINELGRSKTSQLQEDRVPSGRCKGFKVLLDDGQTMTVSLSGFNHAELRHLLKMPELYVDQWIKFKAMKPVKIGGKPRGPAIFTKGDIRDEK